MSAEGRRGQNAASEKSRPKGKGKPRGFPFGSRSKMGKMRGRMFHRGENARGGQVKSY